ncbi:MAG: tetratricopeptide repeat protein [Thermomicrobiales bacterium]
MALGQCDFFQGNEPLARHLFEEALALYRTASDALGAAFALSALGVLAMYQEEFERATTLLEEALALTEGTNDPEVAASMAASAISSLATVAYSKGDLDLAAELAEKALNRCRALGYILGVISNLRVSANVARDRDDHPLALQRFQECLELAHATGDQRWIPDLIEGVAGIALTWRRPEQAARLLGAATTLRERTGMQMRFSRERNTAEPVMAAARAALTEQIFAAAWAAGRTLSRDQAIVEALAVESFGERPAPTGGVNLSARERDVLRLLVAGHTDREIGEALFIGQRTAEGHVGRILIKLGVRSRAATIVAAISGGLVDLPPASPSASPERH